MSADTLSVRAKFLRLVNERSAMRLFLSHTLEWKTRMPLMVNVNMDNLVTGWQRQGNLILNLIMSNRGSQARVPIMIDSSKLGEIVKPD